MKGAVNDNNIDSSQYEKNETDIIKIQAFVRGCLCRVRVSKMVQKMIDEIVLGMRKTFGETNDADADETEHSTSSIDLTTIKPKSYTSHDESVSQGSVSLILSKFEALGDSKSPKSYSPSRKIKPSQEEKKQEEKQPYDEHPVKQEQLPTLEPLELAEEEQKDSKLPAEGQKNSYVKNIKLRSNATSHVSSSEKVLEEQGIRMNNEIQQLLKDIKRVGETGEPSVDFGDLFDDEEVANYYEALVGTLKAAKKKKLIGYDGQYLMKGVHDKVIISIL